MTALPAGDRNKRLAILRSRVVEGDLADTVEWVTIATAWASRRDVSDSERVAAAEVGATITARFQVLRSTALATVNPKDRCSCDGLEYDIVAVKELGYRKGLEITASARTDLE